MSLAQQYDVVIIGGGATGAGTARDCALRGLKVLLVERKDFATGATGRNHGLLHSGARYAVTDQVSAAECVAENKIIRHIARHCVEPTNGLFVTLPEDDLDYQSTFVASCLSAGIDAEVISPDEARRIEPAVNPNLIGAVKVPDCAVDPFRLVSANLLDARLHGAEVLTYHEVVGFVRKQNRIEGIELLNTTNGQKFTVYARVTVNAAGIWGHRVAALAGVDVKLLPSKGSLLVFGHRINNMVINRCRRPADADILVPGDTICLIGTTSDRIPFEDIDKNEVTAAEVEVLLNEGAKLAPGLMTTRILRVYSGVRPLDAVGDDSSGRGASRGIVCIDHAERDGLEGFVTITGGKLTTYRLMAEWATDLVCHKLGRVALCTTASVPLPGSLEEPKPAASRRGRKEFISLSMGEKGAESRHGDQKKAIHFEGVASRALVCECSQVSVAEVKYAIDSLDAVTLVDLKRRTRMGMGTCQGHLCALRAAGLLGQRIGNDNALKDVASFIDERWRGVRPVAWGEGLVEAQFTQWLYEGVCGLGTIVERKAEDKI